MQIGSIVNFRSRDWIVLPPDDDTTVQLRGLVGGSGRVIRVHRRLAKLLSTDLPSESMLPSQFPMPSGDMIGDLGGLRLFWEANRIALRDSTAPLRSLGTIAFRPRLYQLVPLLMSLRLDPVRLFIADDVGVGKTVEALLIARELLDRRLIRRFGVLCPPFLCEQWAEEIETKFNLSPVVIHSGSVRQLERNIPSNTTIYEHYPVFVASIDYVKTERNRPALEIGCPPLLIVDEAHAAADSPYLEQQERHALLRKLVENDPTRHLILLTATPHSGIENAFSSLLGLLNPMFAEWNLNHLTEDQRIHLARHFVHRTRGDIKSMWDSDTPLPAREVLESHYQLGSQARHFFDLMWNYCQGLMNRSGNESPRRMRVWGALNLLRIGMSSPAAAEVVLRRRLLPVESKGTEPHAVVPPVEPSDANLSDEVPSPPEEHQAEIIDESERDCLERLAVLAEALKGPQHDSKLSAVVDIVRQCLDQGFNPILWCRYVVTAEYVAEQLTTIFPDVRVTHITGRMNYDERMARLEEVQESPQRILVSTDCLSEGVNLQEHFNAVIHYDLPWNPNRLEQREGRIDRYGQRSEKVRAIWFYGSDNPVDGAVIEVLLRKARQIHRQLGTYLPVPVTEELLTSVLIQAVFKGKQRQMSLFQGEGPTTDDFHHLWEVEAERERLNRTRFAQRGIKPVEVTSELDAVDEAIGSQS
ncbi:MAG: helicase-related protein, partial [Verrucomicrobiia bacterium]